ncbi:uncharacterized protein LOC104583971 [Brachypodium distachyon]|uniref:uncharacterized protein LOC104583971 n=1 Tax=Brachypodium distachyon TaxID=15368 RepID=UPI00052FE36B|nr:uncharacterized protein LOC104583971 [Brachypodium distachyon]|eukprot:XP_010236325.1 uncharacterized protein LOC104583971 [Brachypodium distachyon]
MTILAWNCRGLGRPRTVQDLVRLVHLHQPKIVFLSETCQRKNVTENLRWRLGLKNAIKVCNDTKDGGLALFWDDSVHVSLNKLGNCFIDVFVSLTQNEITWRCTFVYGEPQAHLHHLMWELLRRLKPMGQAPWCMIGDFNETMWQHEHLSNAKRNERQMQNFRDILSFCDLHDLGFSGTDWTYDNNRQGHRNVRVRLDRAVACSEWQNVFPTAKVSHNVSTCSNHSPILLSCDTPPAVMFANRSRRYELTWEREGDLALQVETAWGPPIQYGDLGDIGQKLGKTMEHLQSWGEEILRRHL